MVIQQDACQELLVMGLHLQMKTGQGFWRDAVIWA
jgi:hypothetical protein